MGFGGMLFEGGDVNGAVMGGVSSLPNVDSMGQGMDNGGLGLMNSMGQPMSETADPAQSAVTGAAGNSMNIMKSIQGYGQGFAGSNQGGGGMLGGLMSGGLPWMSRRVARRQRVYSRHQADFAVRAANNAVAQYQQDSEMQRQKLAQSYAGRGLGESSIQQEGMKYFNDSAARQMAALQDSATLAQNYDSLVHSQIRASYSQQAMGEAMQAIQMVAMVAGAFA